MQLVTDEKTANNYRARLWNMISDAKKIVGIPASVETPAFPNDPTAIAELLWAIDGSGAEQPVGWIYLADDKVHDTGHFPELSYERRQTASYETEVPVRADSLLAAVGFDIDGPDIRDAASDMQGPMGPQSLGDSKYGDFKFLYKGIVQQTAFPSPSEMSVAIKEDGWSALVAMQDGAVVGHTAFVVSSFGGVASVPSFRLASDAEIGLWVEPEVSPTPASW